MHGLQNYKEVWNNTILQQEFKNLNMELYKTSIKVDKAIYNGISNFLEVRTCNTIRHKYPSDIGALRELFHSCFTDRDQLKDDLNREFESLELKNSETAS